MKPTLVDDRPVDAIPAQDAGRGMTFVICIVRPESLEAVKETLSRLEVLGGITLTDVRGFGRQKGQVEHYRGGEYTIRFLQKIKLEIAVHTEDADVVMGAVRRAACTGQVGDGKVFAVELRHAMRIRTGEQGPVAL